MRFQIALNLQKQQVEQESILDQQAAALKPIRDFISKEYTATKVWVDPISQSIARISTNASSSNQ
jgi:ribosomal protein L31E